MASSKISDFGELFLLDRIRKRFKSRSKNVIAGIGDDAAAIKPTDETLLLTTDMMMERVHFDLRFISPFQLGHKLISVNVSDIYAMGGRPSYCLLNIALNADIEASFVDEMLDGIHDALKTYRAVLIGGDLSASEGDLALSATLVGHTRKQVLRSGARVGDRIYVSGSLGESACGLEILKRLKAPVRLDGKGSAKLHLKGLPWRVVAPLVRRHVMPLARDPGPYSDYASAMIDVSDGLLIDLTRLCRESGVGARVYEKRIPVSAEMMEAASSLGLSPMRMALTGGEDYELLFTAPPQRKVRAIYIGDVVKSDKTVVDSEGNERTFFAEGYQHFGK